MQMWELSAVNSHMYLRVCSQVCGRSEKCLTHSESWAELEESCLRQRRAEPSSRGGWQEDNIQSRTQEQPNPL